LRPQPLICVRDVEASSRWYQRLLDGRGDHAGPEYGRIVCGGRLVLQLHDFDVEHHHGRIGDPDQPLGNGVLILFETDDFEAAMARIAELAPEIVMPRHRNSNAMHWECWVRDPDGYTVVIASPDGSA
jgi:catechol 2,3-dioxygenase-like lactoylglutathione lyase family enzyme